MIPPRCRFCNRPMVQACDAWVCNGDPACFDKELAQIADDDQVEEIAAAVSGVEPDYYEEEM